MPSVFSIVAGSGLTLVLVAVTGALLGRSAERRWRQHDDPIGPQGVTLPAGEPLIVKTDDGAELAAMVCEPVGAPTAPAAATASAAAAPATVVLAHCWTGSRLVWAPVARRLVESGHRVVMYDQRGHGESTFGRGAVGISRFGDDLATVLEQLDLRDTVVAGHSMGGFSVMAFACDHPETLLARVRGLVLVGTAAHGLGAGSLTPVISRVLASGVPQRVVRRRRGIFYLRRLVGRQPRYAHLATTRDLFVATPPHVTAACFDCFAPMDLRAQLTAVDLPSVVMVGDRDHLTPTGLSRAMAAALPRTRLEVLEGAGHMLPLETPDQVATAITELAN